MLRRITNKKKFVQMMAEILSSGLDKRQAILQLCIRADGLPYNFIKGRVTTEEKEK